MVRLISYKQMGFPAVAYSVLLAIISSTCQKFLFCFERKVVNRKKCDISQKVFDKHAQKKNVFLEYEVIKRLALVRKYLICMVQK